MHKQIKEVIEGVNIKKVYNEQLLNQLIVTGVKYNSKLIADSNIFVCLPGQHTDGNIYIGEAIKNGAKVIVTSRNIEIKNEKILTILVEDINTALAKLSANFYGHPSKNLLLIGVTGTNGKTTITYLLESIFKTAGYNTAVIGTINYRFNNKIIPAQNTTPFSSDLQELLYEMLQKNIEVVIMEVSSHALDQGRVKECEFDVAIFTNLSQDHLDYHHTMQDYFHAKSILFKTMLPEKKAIFLDKSIGNKFCIINYDDEWGKKLVDLCSIKNILFYSVNSKTKNGHKKYTTANLELLTEKTKFDIIYNGEKVEIISNLIGKFNVYNILASFTAAHSQNISIEKIVEGIGNLSHIPGRLEKVPTPANFSVFIDYAHTPDALHKVISTLKKLSHKKLIVVFGCGGDRDRSKRPLMGTLATKLADWVIVTSDNPRTEDPQMIILDIEVGIKNSGNTNYEIIPDRKNAIFKALSLAQDNDIILLAGKGHETYQIIGNEKIHFDEREIVKDFFSKKT
ncbi:MAG: UDP-N-acetylmuramoyl-L-alanyl-D-glutamate--2,6-diaminopimelate ligase [Endomicrobia bacterium]|nr:UDP-N-acetylmuramoyl-L-alanyl-D-glutamate--2,6-diaminopimelate ligase [Endomicrobiia bacterium]